jgi:hypothetical protein
MSQATPQPAYTPPPVSPPASSNGLGVAGLIVSIVGWLTCGLLCPIGVLLSFFGLFKRPRGLAIAGLIIGIAGSLFLVVFGFAVVAGYFGMKKGIDAMGRGIIIMTAQSTIDEAYVRSNNTLPTDSEGNALIVAKNIQLNGERPVYTVVSPTSYTLAMPGPDATLGTADDVTQTCTAGTMAPQTQPGFPRTAPPSDKVETDVFDD